ncbi:AAA family ATPase [Bradyrhizobium sp. Bra78]|uniref:AAA family ATPase n=1 Tax=Bradyrhizobium sp. Bra78 TaxID=2926010 RepID=UPI0021CA19E3|nr:AAA family ATPase [Bradyrhizobium sp. Bra78]
MIYAFKEYLLDTDRRELWRATALVAAEPQTFDLLLYLVRNRERVVSKDDLLAAIWSGRIVSESTLSSQVNAVRHAIGDDGERQILIRTLPRKGFRFVGEVEERCEREPLPGGEAAAPPQPTDRPEAARKMERPERRQLSVMICDLIGARTHLSGRDPEDLLFLMSACQDRIKAVIAGHDGFIGKSLGDKVVVYFGYPCAREDDAERAVRAGLAVIQEVAGLRLHAKMPLQARVAIATGLVIVGDLNEIGIAADHAAIGDVLPLAAGLLAVTEPGALVISATTHRLVGALFTYRDLGSLGLKSSVDPVRAWQLLSESTATSRFEALHAEPVRLIGREEELALLQRRWSQIKTGEGRLVLIYGEPGIGKSRLVFALREEIKADPHHCLRLQCSPHRVQTAFYPVINQLEHAAGLSAGDSDATKLDKLKALLAPSSQNLARDTALFGELLSIPCQTGSSVLSISPQRRKELLLEQLVGQIAGLAAEKPVLIVLEDAHWVDPTTQELFDILTERIRTLPVLLIITYRPEFVPPWLGQSHVTVMTLNRLGRHDNIEVIRQVANGKDFPPILLEQIVARTDGVPLFIEEMTKSVLEIDIMREENGSYVLTQSLPSLAVPTTLQASLVARLDRLASLRAVVQAGAAFGREFAYPQIRAVCNLGDAELAPLLRQLVASGLVHQRGVVPHAVYTFKHALVQDAAYGTMLKSQRAAIHTRIVEIFERQFPEMLERNPDVLAYHCTEAGSSGKAIDYWLKSTRKSLARSAGIEAEAQLEKAMTLLPNITDQTARQQFEARIQVELGNTFIMTRGFASPDVATALTKARALLDEAAYPIEALRALGALCNYHLIRSESPKLLQLAEPFLRRRVDPPGVMVSHYEAGTAYLHIGRFEDARLHLEKGLSLYEEETPVAFMAGNNIRTFSLVWLSLTYLYLGKLKLATETREAAVSDARSRLHPFTLVSALLASARFFLHTRDLQAAIAATEEGFAIATEQRSPYHISRANILKAVNLVAGGRATEGISLMDAALMEHRDTGANFQSSFNLSCLAEAYARAGNHARALDFAEQAIGEVERSGEHWWAAEAQRLKGTILLTANPTDRRRAEDCFVSALKSAQTQKATFWELRAAHSLASLWSGEGRDTEARKLLAPIYRKFTEGIDLPDLDDARRLLDRLRKPVSSQQRQATWR